MKHEITFLKLIKRIAMEALEASQPMTCVYGRVTSAEPLTIRIGQSLVLEEEYLILSDDVRDHVVERTKIGDDSNGSEKYVEHRSLSVGEEVVMLRCSGGQKYIVMCRRG